MTIELIPETTEINSPELFMIHLGSAFSEALEMNDEVRFKITTLHRQDTDSAETALSLQVNGEDEMIFPTHLTYDGVEELLELSRSYFPDVVVPSFALNQLSNILMSVYGSECDEDELSGLIDKNVFKGSAYQGLISELMFDVSVAGEISLYYRLSAEIYADTETEEKKFLESKGLDPELYRKSSPNKKVQLLYMELEPLKSINS